MATKIAATAVLARPHPSRREQIPAETLPDPERHSRKCVICHHPEREAIEELFIHWHSPHAISHTFGLNDWSAIYRHARAMRLFPLRRRNLRSALEFLIERAHQAHITPMGVIKAVRAYACLTDEGEWIEPPTHVVVSSGTRPAAEAPRLPAPRNPEGRMQGHVRLTRQISREATRGKTALPARAPTKLETSAADSNRQSKKLETPLTRSKQRRGHDSNRQ
jgi:hypothetical protein